MRYEAAICPTDGIILFVDPNIHDTSQKHKPRPSEFWLAFAAAYVPGLLCACCVADVFLWRRTGGERGGDGNLLVAGLIFSPLFVVVAALIKKIFRRYNSIGFAIAFAMLAPTLGFLLLTAVEG